MFGMDPDDFELKMHCVCSSVESGTGTWSKRSGTPIGDSTYEINTVFHNCYIRFGVHIFLCIFVLFWWWFRTILAPICRWKQHRDFQAFSHASRRHVFYCNTGSHIFCEVFLIFVMTCRICLIFGQIWVVKYYYVITIDKSLSALISVYELYLDWFKIRNFHRFVFFRSCLVELSINKYLLKYKVIYFH